MKRVLAVSGLLLFADPAAAADFCGPVLSVIGAAQSVPVTLYGTLDRQFAWGPPNFGEKQKTDTHWQPWVLKLAHPIRAVSGEDNVNDPPVFTKIQVRGKFEGNGGYIKFLHRHVAVTGTLYEAAAPSDITDIAMETAQIVPAEAPPCVVHR